MIFFYPILFLVGLYGSIWIYLLYGHYKEQRYALKAFMDAWENDLYKAKETKSNFTSVLRITFPCNQGLRCIDVNEEGTLLGPIRWADSGRDSTEPSKRLKQKLEQYTQQIATMYKLEHGGFDNDEMEAFAI